MTHPNDITKILSDLVKQSFLESDGVTRGTYYFFPGEPPNTEDHLIEASFEHSMSSSEHSKSSSEHSEYSLLLNIAAEIRGKKRADPELMEATIQKLCSNRYLLLKTLAELLQRSPDTIRTHYLSPMLKEGLLELRYPDITNHPEQAYRTREEAQLVTEQ